MLGKVICALACAALIPATATAQGRGGGGGGGGGPAGVGGGMGNAGGLGGGLGNGGIGGGIGNAGGMGNGIGIQMRDASRINSQGPSSASAMGIGHANQNSVLSGSGTATGNLNALFPGTHTTTAVTSGTLSGLTTGMTLMSNGTAVGTVQQIRTAGNGTVAVVIVRGTNGSFFAIPATKLSLSGGILSTTARLNGINGSSQARLNSQGLMHASPTGIAHANFHSVLARGMVVSGSLAGLTKGLTVNTSTGTRLGTVSQIVTDSSGNIRLVIVTSSTGQAIRLSPSSLTLSGGVVTTTQKFG